MPREGRVDRGSIQSLERAAALLEAVATAPEGATLSEMSERVGLHTSTAFHLVRTLEATGFLVRQPDKRYRIGSRLFVLAAGALDEAALLTHGQPVLERLSRETGEAAHLAVRSNADIVVVARTEATGMLQMSLRTGVMRPAHATAIGKLLLAQCPDDVLDGILARLDLAPFTPATITEPAQLRAEIDQVRRSGLAHDRGELDPDVRCIAVAVRDFAGRSVAAIGISGPVWRMADDVLVTKEAALRRHAAALSNLLGGAAAEAARTDKKRAAG